MATVSEAYKGYRDEGLEALKKFDVHVWDRVRIKADSGVFEGVILPRNEMADTLHIVLKLDSGYNVGVRAARIQEIENIGRKEGHYQVPEKEFPYDPDKRNVLLLGTGGTIASRLDYTTGAVIPAFSPGELYGAVPELAEICNLTTRKVFGIFSEDMSPREYIPLAKTIYEEINNGAEGIIIGHGTDTMHHTAAILTFMVQNPPVPIVLVGSQRSSDRPSSDAARNLINAAMAATGPIAEIMVCMFGPTSDQYGLLHRGTRVRKMHSSYRSTFRTLGDRPLATVDRENGVKPLREDYNKRGESTGEFRLTPAFNEKVTILYYYPNMQEDLIRAIVNAGYEGIVIAGTGLGHVNRPLYDVMRWATGQGVHIYMTVQTLWGYVQMFVYDNGRYLMDCGIVPLANMLPEVAFMKLSWALGQTKDRDEVKKIMLEPVNGEITEREPPDGYLVFQGGLPEIENFLKDYLL
ncbi:MAG: Glu-tRNA(Gln) amidotransferase subunit GatD [candidate division Zixibacteria bacterium]|nr:Glu-tRNA(Gln) amidotransferase subunit GatD [candidate division Zixibacteria bacterium]